MPALPGLYVPALADPTTTRGDTIARGASALVRVALPANQGLLGSDGTDIVAKGGKFNCVVTKSVNQSFANATVTVVSFDVETFDNGNFHSNSVNNSRLTVPVAGRYLWVAHQNWAGNGIGQRIISCFINAANHYWIRYMPNGESNASGGALCLILDLAANDYVEMAGYQSSGGNLNLLGGTSQDHTRMGITLLAGQ